MRPRQMPPGLDVPGARGRAGTAPSTSQSRAAQQQALQTELDDLYHKRDVLLGRVQETGPDGQPGEPGAVGRSGNRMLFGRTAGGPPMVPITGRPVPGMAGAVPMSPLPGPGFGWQTQNPVRQPTLRHTGQPMDKRMNFADGKEQERIEPIVVWAHDMTVEPGRTYRYRIRVAVRNPFFQRSRVVEAQKPLAKQHSLESEPSDWTDEVSTFRKTYFYLVDDGNRNEGGIVEMYRRFDGGWQRIEAPVRAGEPIGGEHMLVAADLTRKIDLADDLDAIVVDVDTNVPSLANASRSTVRMLYLDLKTNVLMERTIERDKNDKRRIYLRNEAQLEAERIKMARVEQR